MKVRQGNVREKVCPYRANDDDHEYPVDENFRGMTVIGEIQDNPDESDENTDEQAGDHDRPCDVAERLAKEWDL